MQSPTVQAANDFIAGASLVAWEPAEARRAMSLLNQFARGDLDSRTLRAAFGGRPTTASETRPRGVAVLNLSGVLTPSESIFTMFGAGTSLASFIRQLKSAAADSSVSSMQSSSTAPADWLAWFRRRVLRSERRGQGSGSQPWSQA